MGQQKKPQNGGVGDLVVKCLAMEVQEGRVDADVISTTRCQALQLSEDADGISGGLDDVCLG